MWVSIPKIAENYFISAFAANVEVSRLYLSLQNRNRMSESSKTIKTLHKWRKIPTHVDLLTYTPYMYVFIPKVILYRN